VLVPEKFNWTVDFQGGIEMYPQGDTGVPPAAVMPKDSFFFDATRRQEPFDEENPLLEDNCEEFGLFGKEDVAHFVDCIKPVYEQTQYGIYLTFPGSGFGDIALVPATWMKRTKGIRDLEEWYVSTITRRDFIYAIFERQCEIALKNIETLARAVGDRPQVVFVSGADFGTQRGLFASVETYRDLFKSFHKRVNDKIHALTKWKTFIHSCGAIRELIPDFIEAGFDVLNPVQCSAEGMDAKQLKQEFGKQLVFWGGGVDTQGTLPFGTPDEVYWQVRERIDIFNQDGGFVFNSVHNVQSNVPVDNMLAMFKAIKDSGKQ
jgi:hypothetical protein